MWRTRIERPSSVSDMTSAIVPSASRMRSPTCRSYKSMCHLDLCPGDDCVPGPNTHHTPEKACLLQGGGLRVVAGGGRRRGRWRRRGRPARRRGGERVTEARAWVPWLGLPAPRSRRGFAGGGSLWDRSFLRQDDGGAGGEGRGGGAGAGGRGGGGGARKRRRKEEGLLGGVKGSRIIDPPTFRGR